MRFIHTLLSAWVLAAALLGALGCKQAKPADVAVVPQADAAHPSGAEALVRSAFAAYKAALLARDGQAAVAVVSEETLAYFEARRRDALTLSADETRRARTLDKTMILIMRARLGKRLADMTREGLFSHAVDQGWVGSEVATVEVVDVQVTSDESKATTSLKSGSQVLPMGKGFEFFHRDGAWKIDVMSIVSVDTDREFDKQLTLLDPDPEKAMLQLISTLTGTAQTEALFAPLAPKAP